MDLRDIQNLIKFVAKSGASEVKLEMEDVKITIKTGSEKTETTIVQHAVPVNLPQMPATSVTSPMAQTPAAETNETNENSNYIEITSPIIGTFYRKPSPDKPVFVEVGDVISNDTVVCMVEAMKLFNEIEAEVSGKIIKILVTDGTPIEYGQPLFLIDPS